MSGCVLANQFFATKDVPLYIPLAGSKYRSGTFTVTKGGSTQTITIFYTLNAFPTIIITPGSADAGCSAVFVALYTLNSFSVSPCSGTFGDISTYKYTILN
jgi:hypothetical protein